MTSSKEEGATTALVSKGSPSVLDIALQYIEGGLNVTPVASPTSGDTGAGKAAFLDDWQKRRLTADEFKKVYKARKGSINLGVITGKSSGIVVIDLDGLPGVAWYEENKELLGHYIAERRGSSSLHLFFKHPGGDITIPSRVKLYPGVDISADGGKQIVTWPSIHRSGDQYKFDNGLNLLDVAHECDILPQWLIDEISTSEAINSTAVREPMTPETLDAPVDIERCIEMLKTAKPAIENQGGDQQTFIVAATCCNIGISKGKAFELMRAHYNPRCVPPWSDSDLRKKVQNGFKHGKLGAGSDSTSAILAMFPDDLADSAIDDEPKSKKETSVYNPKFPVVSAETYINRNPRRTLCASGQLYRYSEKDRCWGLIRDEQFKSIVMADIEKASFSTHKALKMNQLNEIATAIKRRLEGENPDREIKVDSWLTGRRGEFISCSNGILDIATGDLHPHSSDWFSFTTLPFAFNREAQCPTFERFLESLWGNDEEIKESLRLWMGYLLIGSMKEQKFAVFKGASRAGKGTLVRVIESLVGARNFAACSINSFGGDFGLEPILGKRLAIFNDAESGTGKEGRIATERIKSITGNDSLPINQKGSTILTMALPTKIIFVCNSMPAFVNDQNAMTNRMIAFPFEKTFIGEEDLDLGKKLKDELSGILNWALKGARALMVGNKLSQSAAGALMVEEISISLDPIKAFVRDVIKVTKSTDHKVESKDLWLAFKNWCEGGNFRASTQDKFSKGIKPLLMAKGATDFGGAIRGYYGVVIDVDSSHEIIDAFSDVDDDF